MEHFDFGKAEIKDEEKFENLFILYLDNCYMFIDICG